MRFFIRFLLGLPARKVDIEEMREALPEAFEEDHQLQPKWNRKFWWLLGVTNENFGDELKFWAKSSEIDSEAGDTNPKKSCPRQDCPLKEDQKFHGDNENLDVVLVSFLTAGGGPQAKPPLNMFLNLVKKTHVAMGVVKEVILTDPYIYSDLSEDGVEGGVKNLMAYLDALNLNSKSSFTLKTNPSPKRATKMAKEALHKKIIKSYPNASLGNYSPECNFHDRFYIVRDDRGHLGGVFGPSLNGLSSNAIVLMGDLNGEQVFKKLSAWL